MTNAVSPLPASSIRAASVLARVPGALWIRQDGAGGVRIVRLGDDGATRQVSIGGAPSAIGLSVAGGSAWLVAVGATGDRLVQVAAATMRARVRPLGDREAVRAVATPGGGAWVLLTRESGRPDLVRVDRRGRVVARAFSPRASLLAATGRGALVVALGLPARSTVTEVDRRGRRVRTGPPVPGLATDVVTAFGAVYLSGFDASGDCWWVARLDPAHLARQARAGACEKVVVDGITAAGGSIWALRRGADDGAESLQRLDPSTLAAQATIAFAS